MTSVLVDDTKGCSAISYGPVFGRELREIAKHRVDRFRAYKWARNLRFLCSDDDGDDGNDHHHSQVAVRVAESRNTNRDEDVYPGETSETCRGDASTRKVGQDEHVSTPGEADASQGINLNENGESDDESESAMLDYAIAMSLAHEQDLVVPEHAQHKNTETEWKPPTCATCLKYPTFPARPRKFRIVQFSEEELSRELCDHYIAISYCWHSDGSGNQVSSQKSYTVRDTVAGSGCRRNRAPDSILDRAVDCARALQARLIWLDQECLPQEACEERELGIQAMDMVYQRANWCVGLLDSEILLQNQMDAIATALDWASTKDHSKRRLRRHPDSELTMDTLLDDLMDVLELFARDKWNSRAWILQEAFSASERLMLNMRTAPAIEYRGGSSSSLRTPTDLVPGSFTILMSDLDSFVQASKEYLHTCARINTPTGVVVSMSLSSRFNEERVYEILEALEHIHLRSKSSVFANKHAHVLTRESPFLRPRKACNAATAVTFLRSRFNHRPADRLAILANLADYEVRLDTVKIEQCFKSLSVCIFVLAYINGDLSLLTTEVYQAAKVQAPIEGPSWTLPIAEILHSADMTHLRAGDAPIVRNPRRYNFSTSGAIMPAYVWDVNRKVNLKFIRRKWASPWKKWQCTSFIIQPREGESIDEFLARREELYKLAAEGKGPEILKSVSDGQKVIDWSTDQLGFDDQVVATHTSRILSTSRIEQDKGAQWIIGLIFQDILAYLHDIDEIALANSIWHTIRNDCVNDTGESGPDQHQSDRHALPDSVVDLLLDEGLMSDLFRQMQLDRNNRGPFNQAWIIDRVMQDGFLWVGNYTTMTSNIHLGDDGSNNRPQTVEDLEQIVNGENSEAPERRPLYQPTQLQELLMGMLFVQVESFHEALNRSAEIAPLPRHPPGESGRPPLLMWQTFKLISATLFRLGCFNARFGPGAGDEDEDADEEGEGEDVDMLKALSSLPQGAFVTFLLLNLFGKHVTDETLGERVSAFDVDGPCTVVTPYDTDMERLPRSVVRSMDTAWVVEVVHRKKEDGTQGVEEPAGDGGKGKVRVPFGQDEAPTDSEEKVEQQVDDDYHGDATFRVLNRVRGAWEIMDENKHEYEFV